MSDGDSSSDFSGNEIAPKLNDPVGFAVFGVATIGLNLAIGYVERKSVIHLARLLLKHLGGLLVDYCQREHLNRFREICQISRQA